LVKAGMAGVLVTAARTAMLLNSGTVKVLKAE
jgi:hypothetical protein